MSNISSNTVDAFIPDEEEFIKKVAYFSLPSFRRTLTPDERTYFNNKVGKYMSDHGDPLESPVKINANQIMNDTLKPMGNDILKRISASKNPVKSPSNEEMEKIEKGLLTSLKRPLNNEEEYKSTVNVMADPKYRESVSPLNKAIHNNLIGSYKSIHGNPLESPAKINAKQIVNDTLKPMGNDILKKIPSSKKFIDFLNKK